MRSRILRLIQSALIMTVLLAIVSPALSFAAISNPLEKVCDSSSGNDSSTVCQDQQKTQGQTVTNNSIYGPNGIITKTARLLSLIIGIVAVVMIMFAGFKFITSQGDAAQVASARNTAIYAVVGLIIVAVAQGIIIFVLDRIR